MYLMRWAAALEQQYQGATQSVSPPDDRPKAVSARSGDVNT
jgi:hypothetical protein